MQINPDKLNGKKVYVNYVEFQSYQFMQINPDPHLEIKSRLKHLWKFQSYQLRQINPDFIN